MKLAFMSFSTPGKSFDEMLAIAQAYGYDGIEPRLDANHAHGLEVAASVAERTAFRQRAAEAGVGIACLATSLKFVDPDTEQTLAQARERLALAGEVGAPVIRVFGGKVPEGMSREAAIDRCASTLAAVADFAKDAGVVICFETHDDWCNPVDVAAVLRRVNHPAIACNWDVQHPVRTGYASIDESFDTLKPWIRHLHIHDNVGEGLNFVPIGTGDIDHKRVLERLKDISFNGYLSGEWINWEPHDVHLPREIAQLKRYEEELAQG